MSTSNAILHRGLTSARLQSALKYLAAAKLLVGIDFVCWHCWLQACVESGTLLGTFEFDVEQAVQYFPIQVCLIRRSVLFYDVFAGDHARGCELCPIPIHEQLRQRQHLRLSGAGPRNHHSTCQLKISTFIFTQWKHTLQSLVYDECQFRS